MGKRGKASSTKQLGKIQRAVLVNLLIFRELAKRGKLNGGENGTRYLGGRFASPGQEIASKKEVETFGVPYRLLTRYLEGNVRRAVEGLEDKKLVVSCRSEGDQRTHVKLTASGTKLARQFYLPGDPLIRNRRKRMLQTWELKFGDYQAWSEDRKQRFESTVRDVQREQDDHSRVFSKTIGATWRRIEPFNN